MSNLFKIHHECRGRVAQRSKGPIRGLLLCLAVVLLSAPLSAVVGQFIPQDPETFYPPPSLMLRTIDEQVLALALSPDGKRLVTAGARHTQPGQFKVWDVEKAKELVSIRGGRGIRGVAFSPDGSTIACGEFGGAVRLREAASGKQVAVLEGHTIGVNAVAYSRDGTLLASAGLDRVVKIWDVKEQREKQVLNGHTGMVYTVAFFRDGKTIVTGGADRTARIWDLATGKEKFILSGHQQPVEMVAVSPNDKLVATVSWDRTIRLWDAETGKEAGVLAGSAQALFSLAFSPLGELLASGSADGTVSLWDVKTKKMVGKHGNHAGPVWAMAFTPDGKTLATGSSDRTAKLWNVASMRSSLLASVLTTVSPTATFDTSELKPIRALASSPDGKILAIATDDGKVRLFDAKTSKLLFVLAGHKGVVKCLAFSPDGQILAGGSSEHTVTLWDRATGKEKRTWKAHAGGVYALAFTPGGKQLASGGEDKMIRLWDIASGNEKTIFSGHEAGVHALAFAPDGRGLASGGADRTIRVWDPERPEVFRPLRGHQGTVRVLVFSTTGELASAGDDGTVRLWQRDQNNERLTLKGHSTSVSALAFSPGGGRLVSGGKDKRVLVWDVQTGKSRGVLHAHAAEITGLAIDPAGQYLLSAGADASLYRWSSTRPLMAAVPPAAEATSPRVRRVRPDVPSDWPGWRGPAGDGIRSAATPVLNWSPTSGVQWRVPVPGRGHASPVIVGDRIIISTADEQAETRRVLCYHRQTGAVLWNVVIHQAGFMNKHGKNSHATPTPVSDGSLVYVPYIAGDALWLSAINIQNGQIVWQPRLGPFVSQWGYAASPVLYKDLVIVVADNKGAAPVNAAEPTSYLVAVHRKSGEIAWRAPRLPAPSYGSPVVGQLTGRDQLLLGGSERISAYDPATGKELWFCRWSADRSANSVVWGDGRVYASTNFPNEEIICVRADGNGDVTDSHVVWRQNRNAADVSAPLYRDGRLYLFSDKGIASCLDGATGNALWTMRLGPAFASSPVLAGDRIFVTDETGTTYVLQAGPEFKLLARNSINQQVLASPALSGDRLFLRTGRFLWCVDGQADSRPANIVPPGANNSQPGSRPPVGQALAPPQRNTQTPLVGGVSKVKANRDYGMILFAALLLLLLVSLGGLLIVVHVRRSSSVILDESCAIVEPEPESTPEVIAFTCSGCSKKLRGTAFMAGKKIKCPRCGTAVLVPGGSEHPDGYKKA